MPRPLNMQKVVITGASSGIGRETAIRFASKGASVVLAARNELALQEVALEAQKAGGEAHVVVTDVSEWEQVRNLAQSAVDRFGRIDTWVNNAAVSLYGSVEEIPPEEINQVIQVNLMGQIHGMKAILPHMKRQGKGTIINNASVLAVRAVPWQSAYSASKHGVKGFTEALRLELEHEHSQINVTLILTSSINTPLFNHARSYLKVRPRPIPPVYEPSTVAEAILFAAEHPVRDLFIGGMSKTMAFAEQISPRLLDRYMLRNGNMFKKQKTDKPDYGESNLFNPMPDTGSITRDFGEKAATKLLQLLSVKPH